MLRSKQTWIILGTAVLLFIVTRILFLWFLPPGYFWNEEELLQGVLAHDHLSNGLTRPILDYTANTYTGGSMIANLMAVPFFLLFGHSAFVLKLVALVFFTATLIVWILFCLRHYNRTAAILFSIFYIFSTPYFTRISVLTMGFYTETVLFTALAVVLFCEIFFKQKSHWFYYIALGLVIGFGIWFNYVMGITLITLLLCWFFHDHKFLFKRCFWIFSLGFLLGFSPWIYYNLTHQFLGLWVEWIPLHRFFNLKGLLELFNPSGTLFVGISEMLDFRNLWIIDWKVSLLIYGLVFITACLFLLWNNRKNLLTSRETIFVIYFMVMGPAYQTCGMPYPTQLTPLYPFVFIILALFFNALLGTKNKFKVIASLLFIFLMAFMALGSDMNVLSARFAGYGVKAKGYSYQYFGAMDVWKGRWRSSIIYKYHSLSKNIKSANLEEYTRGFADYLDFKSASDFIETINFAKQIDPRCRKYFYRQIGAYIRPVLNTDFKKAKEIIQRIEVKDQKYAYEGWIESFAYANDVDYADKMKMLSQFDSALYPFFYRKLGEAFDERDYKKVERKYLPDYLEGVGIYLFGMSILSECDSYDSFRREDIFRFVQSLDKKQLRFIYSGMGKKTADLVKEDPANIMIRDRIFKALPVEYQKYCWEGYNAEK